MNFRRPAISQRVKSAGSKQPLELRTIVGTKTAPTTPKYQHSELDSQAAPSPLEDTATKQRFRLLK
jgi:hypothetical protein